MKIKSLPRRTFLRGVGGVAVALPVLDIMLDSHGEALADGGELPCRFFVGFNGQSTGADGDTVHSDYVGPGFGPNYQLATATQPLSGYDGVQSDVSVVSNLRIPYGDNPPAGGWRNDFHIQALNPLISGMRSELGDEYSVQGVTADQVVAQAIGQTTFDSLQYQVQASWYLNVSAPYGRDVISYRLDGGGALVPVPGQVSPQAAYQSLFTGFVPPDPADALALERELLKRRSVLDMVMASIDQLQPSLGAADQIRMQRHYDEIRDLEMRLAATPPEAGEQCFQFMDPGQDPAVGGNQDSNGGDGFDINAGWSDETTRARTFSDLVHMAYTCDLTRSVALLYTMAQSHMNIHSITGDPYDQHELGHSGTTTTIFSQTIAWHVDHFAYLVAKLRDTPEGAGSVLDNSALVLLHEGGHGFDPGAGDDNSSHSTENMFVMIAGHAGGLTGGLHVDGLGRHPVNVLNTAMAAVGVDENLGEVVGTVDELFQG